jgi:LacI family transcriptional regulator, galactose operon repressor
MSGQRSRPTMREVAALAGVSLKTVSRVVNAEPGVSPTLRDQVTQAVRALDYRPNLAASSLRRGAARTHVVGVLVPDLADPLTAGLLAALEAAASTQRTRLLVASLGSGPEREQELLRDLVSRRADGIVLVPAADEQGHLRTELRSGTPVVVVDRVPRGVSADSVVIDHASGALEATSHLLAGGHRRVAGLFQALPEVVARRRREGFAAAFSGRGRPLRPELLVTGLGTPEHAGSALDHLLDGRDPPTALVTSGPAATTGALRTLTARGLRGTVAHVALDVVGGSDLLTPPLTVVRYDVSRLGAVAADLLLERVGGRTGRARRVVLQPSLVARGSGEIPPPP